MPRLEAFDIGAKWDLKNSVYWAEGPSFNPRGGEIWAVQAWRKQKDGQLRLPELTFVGCFGNGGNHARWNRVSSKDKSKSQCTREAMENGHAYMMMEWSEGFKHGHAECSTLKNLPRNAQQFKTDDAECRSDDGELIGRSAIPHPMTHPMTRPMTRPMPHPPTRRRRPPPASPSDCCRCPLCLVTPQSCMDESYTQETRRGASDS